MTKAEQARAVYASCVDNGLDRKATINVIIAKVGVSAAYASTLYAGTKKAAAPKAGEAFKAAFAPEPKLPSTTPRITKAMLGPLRHEIEEALDNILANHGLRAELGSITYTDLSFRAKLEVSVDAEDENGLDVAAKREWDLHCFRSNLNEDDFGKKFKTPRGEAFTITSYNRRGRKTPVIATRDKDGVEFRFSGSVISELLNRPRRRS